MKRIITTAILFAVALVAPVVLTAQTSSPEPPACTSVNLHAGDPALQATFTDETTGAVYANAVWTVAVNGIDTSHKVVRAMVVIYASASLAQNSCIQPVKTIPLTLTGVQYANYFAVVAAPASGQTIAHYLEAQALAAIKTHPTVSGQLATATSITL